MNISNSVNAPSKKQFSLSLRPEPPFGLTDADLARRFGLSDPLRDVARNKLFQSLVKHMVKDTLVQRGIPIRESIPGVSPTIVTQMMAGIGAHEGIANFIMAYKDVFKGPAEDIQNEPEDEKDDVKKQK